MVIDTQYVDGENEENNENTSNISLSGLKFSDVYDTLVIQNFIDLQIKNVELYDCTNQITTIEKTLFKNPLIINNGNSATLNHFKQNKIKKK